MMTAQDPPSPRKKRLCHLLRQTASLFISETEADSPASQRESFDLRSDSDALVTLYEQGLIDPVKSLRAAPLEEPPAATNEPAPLHAGR